MEVGEDLVGAVSGSRRHNEYVDKVRLRELIGGVKIKRKGIRSNTQRIPLSKTPFPTRNIPV